MGSSTDINFTVRILWIQIVSPDITKSRSLKVSINLFEGGSKIFFAYLPSIAGYIARSCPFERKNCPVSEVYRLTSILGKKSLCSEDSSNRAPQTTFLAGEAI